MLNILEIPDSGFITVKLATGEQVQLDCYETYNQIIDLSGKNSDDDKPLHEFHQAVVELLMSKGLPRVSHFQADVFVKRLQEAVAALKKTVGFVATPDSPLSTEPESSPSPAA